VDRTRLQNGQSLVEFAISSIVLVLLFGGLVDLSRAIQFSDVLHNSAREGARTGAWFSEADPTKPNPHLNDTDIKTAVDRELVAGGLPGSVLENSVTLGTCPLSVTDGNSQSNPPYATSNFPGTVNQPWLYICKTAGTPADLNVAVLMTYGPLTGFLPTGSVLGGFPIATNWHLKVQR
jgi:Flp pilus assembly protein TadG